MSDYSSRHHKGSSYYISSVFLSILLWGGYAIFSQQTVSIGHFELPFLFVLLIVQVLMQTAILRRYIPMPPQGDGLSAYLLVLFVSTNPVFYHLDISVVSSFFIAYSIFALFYVYHTDYSAIAISTSGFLIGVASVLWLPNILFLPIWIWSLYTLRSFHLRSVLAMLVGVFAAWWMALPIFYFTDSWQILTHGMSDLVAIRPFWEELDLKNITILSGFVMQPIIMILLMLWALQSLKMDYWRLKMRVRSNMSCLMNVALISVLLYIIMGRESVPFLYSAALPISILFAQAISYLHKRHRVIITNVLTIVMVANYLLIFLL